MSYDLFFRAKSTHPPIDYDEFARYFGARSNYALEDRQAWYTNNDTSVYFVFEYGDPEEEEDEGKHYGPLVPVSFNLNYFRPRVFGLEAESEVRAFLTAFDLLVCDPQNDGMGEGEYSAGGFLQGWDAGNAFAYQAIGERNPETMWRTLPTATIEACWRWNFARQARQAAIGDDAFVPKIVAVSRDGKVTSNGKLATGGVWGDGVASLMPKVELLVVPRQQFAPRRLFRSTQDIVVLEWQQVEAIATDFPRSSLEPQAYELFYPQPPQRIEQLIRTATPPTVLPEIFPFDQVLNRELAKGG